MTNDDDQDAPETPACWEMDCHGKPQRVAVTLPHHYDDDVREQSDAGEIVKGLLNLLAGNGDHAACGRRLIICAYLSGALPDCETDRDLAKRLNISPGRVSQIIAEIRSKIPSLAKCKRRQAGKA